MARRTCIGMSVMPIDARRWLMRRSSMFGVEAVVVELGIELSGGGAPPFPEAGSEPSLASSL